MIIEDFIRFLMDIPAKGIPWIIDLLTSSAQERSSRIMFIGIIVGVLFGLGLLVLFIWWSVFNLYGLPF
jgi:hypothetical protein